MDVEDTSQDDQEVIDRSGSPRWTSARPRWCAACGCRARAGRAALAGGAHVLHDDPLAAGAGRLADRRCGVTRVVMEATGDYWKPPFYLLEAAGFEIWLVNAHDVKHLPGRPEDRHDGRGVAVQGRRAAACCGPSFVPPAPIRQLRDLTRYRVDLVGERTAEKNRVEKLLEDAQIKLSVVASRHLRGLRPGDDGRADRRRTRPEHAGRSWPAPGCGAKIPDLQEAFVGRFTDHHAFLLATMLAHIDALDGDIAAVEARIEDLIAPFADAVARLGRHPRHRTGRRCDDHRRDRRGHDPVPDRRPPGLLGQVRPRRQGVRRQDARATSATGHGNRYLARALGEAAVGRRPNRHLPRRTLPTHRPPPRQEEGHRRRRPLHPGHHLAPARRPRPPTSSTSAPTTTTTAPAPNAPSATTSADSKPSATASPSTRRLTASNPSRLRCAPPGPCRTSSHRHFRTRRRPDSAHSSFCLGLWSRPTRPQLLHKAPVGLSSHHV